MAYNIHCTGAIDIYHSLGELLHQPSLLSMTTLVMRLRCLKSWHIQLHPEARRGFQIRFLTLCSTPNLIATPARLPIFLHFSLDPSGRSPVSAIVVRNRVPS